MFKMLFCCCSATIEPDPEIQLAVNTGGARGTEVANANVAAKNIDTTENANENIGRTSKDNVIGNVAENTDEIINTETSENDGPVPIDIFKELPFDKESFLAMVGSSLFPPSHNVQVQLRETSSAIPGPPGSPSDSDSPEPPAANVINDDDDTYEIFGYVTNGPDGPVSNILPEPITDIRVDPAVGSFTSGVRFFADTGVSFDGRLALLLGTTGRLMSFVLGRASYLSTRLVPGDVTPLLDIHKHEDEVEMANSIRVHAPTERWLLLLEEVVRERGYGPLTVISGLGNDDSYQDIFNLNIAIARLLRPDAFVIFNFPSTPMLLSEVPAAAYLGEILDASTSLAQWKAAEEAVFRRLVEEGVVKRLIVVRLAALRYPRATTSTQLGYDYNSVTDTLFGGAFAAVHLQDITTREMVCNALMMPLTGFENGVLVLEPRDIEALSSDFEARTGIPRRRLRDTIAEGALEGLHKLAP